MKHSNIVVMFLLAGGAVFLSIGCGSNQSSIPNAQLPRVETINEAAARFNVPEDPRAVELIAMLNGPPWVSATGAQELAKIGPGAHKAVPALIGLVRAKQTLASANACGALTKIGPVAMPQLVDALSDSDPQFRTSIYGILGRYGANAKSVLPTLEKALDMETGKAHHAVIVAICKIDPGRTEALLPELIADARNQPYEDRDDAIWSLGEIGPAAAPALPLLAELAMSKGDFNEFYVTSALGQIGPAAVPTLMTILQGDNAAMRAHAAKALGEIGPPANASVTQLKKALADESRDVRTEASEALLKIDRAGSEDALLARHIEALGNTSREGCKEATLALRPLGPKAEPAVPALLKIMSGSDAELREEAVITLGEIGPGAKAAVPALIEALNDTQADAKIREKIGPHGIRLTSFRARAAHSLGQIGPAARAAIGPLDDLRQVQDTFLRAEAADAVRKIQK